MNERYQVDHDEKRREILTWPQHINPLTPELNPSAQRCLTRFFYWGYMCEKPTNTPIIHSVY
jgi:hypothetical protein